MAACSRDLPRPSWEISCQPVWSVCPLFNISMLHDCQLEALCSFVNGEDVFGNLPTGFKAVQSAILRTNYNLCIFCIFMQNYKVHACVISMEFSEVNHRHPHEMPLGLGAKKDGCFHKLEVSLQVYVSGKEKNISMLQATYKLCKFDLYQSEFKSSRVQVIASQCKCTQGQAKQTLK